MLSNKFTAHASGDALVPAQHPWSHGKAWESFDHARYVVTAVYIVFICTSIMRGQSLSRGHCNYFSSHVTCANSRLTAAFVVVSKSIKQCALTATHSTS